jgi:hypothetical protein
MEIVMFVIGCLCLAMAVAIHMGTSFVRRRIADDLVECKQLNNHYTAMRNQTELNLFSYKEQGLFLSDTYRIILDMLYSLEFEGEVEEDDQDMIDQAIEIGEQGLITIEEHFINTFGVTPDQYRQKAFKTPLKKKDGEISTGPFGLN